MWIVQLTEYSQAGVGTTALALIELVEKWIKKYVTRVNIFSSYRWRLTHYTLTNDDKKTARKNVYEKVPSNFLHIVNCMMFVFSNSKLYIVF